MPSVARNTPDRQSPGPIVVADEHGLLGGVLGRDPVRITETLPRNLGECFAVLWRAGAQQLWVAPDALEPLGLPCELTAGDERLPFGVAIGHEFCETPPTLRQASPAGLRPMMRVGSLKRPDVPPVTVHIPCWDNTSPWWEVEGGGALWRSVCGFPRVADGALWADTGGITSELWLRARYGRRIRHAPIPDEVRDDIGPGVTALHWIRRQLSDTETRGRFAHRFDIRGQFLASAGSVSVPSGEAQLVEAAPWRAGEPPGWWELAEAPPWDHPRLPPMTPPRRWLTTQEAAFALQLGGRLSGRAWLWPEHGRWLKPWADWLRAARSNAVILDDAPTLRAVKATYTVGLGRLGSGQRARWDDPMHQPHWRQAVVAEATTRLLRHLIGAKLRPVIVWADAAWFLSSRGPESFARAAGLDTGPQLGKWVHEATIPGREFRRILDGTSQPAATMKALGEAVAAADGGDGR